MGLICISTTHRQLAFHLLLDPFVSPWECGQSLRQRASMTEGLTLCPYACRPENVVLSVRRANKSALSIHLLPYAKDWEDKKEKTRRRRSEGEKDKGQTLYAKIR